MDTEALRFALLVPLEPSFWAQKAELRLQSLPGVACLMASSIFVFRFRGGHLIKLLSGFLGAAPPNG